MGWHEVSMLEDEWGEMDILMVGWVRMLGGDKGIMDVPSR